MKHIRISPMLCALYLAVPAILASAHARSQGSAPLEAALRKPEPAPRNLQAPPAPAGAWISPIARIQRIVEIYRRQSVKPSCRARNL
jgi:hypothetical protein